MWKSNENSQRQERNEATAVPDVDETCKAMTNVWL